MAGFRDPFDQEGIDRFADPAFANLYESFMRQKDRPPRPPSTRFMGSDLLQQSIREDREFYDSTFKDDLLNLRAIALGVGDTNAYRVATQAGKDSNRAFGSAMGSYQRGVERVGGVSRDKQQSQLRRLGLARVLAQVDASNNAITAAGDRRKAAAASLTQLYGDLTTDANAALRSIAEAEQDREAQYKSAKSGATSSGLGAAGSIVGSLIAMM